MADLNTVLLQKLLDLKSETDSKIEELVLMIQQTQTFPASKARNTQKSNPSLKANHINMGVRWEAEDYSPNIELNNSSRPNFFVSKVTKDTSAGTKASVESLKISGSNLMNGSQFLAFRARRGSLQDHTPLKKTHLDNIIRLESVVSRSSSCDSIAMTSPKWTDNPQFLATLTRSGSSDSGINFDRRTSVSNSLQRKSMAAQGIAVKKSSNLVSQSVLASAVHTEGDGRISTLPRNSKTSSLKSAQRSEISEEAKSNPKTNAESNSSLNVSDSLCRENKIKPASISHTQQLIIPKHLNHLRESSLSQSVSSFDSMEFDKFVEDVKLFASPSPNKINITELTNVEVVQPSLPPPFIPVPKNAGDAPQSQTVSQTPSTTPSRPVVEPQPPPKQHRFSYSTASRQAKKLDSAQKKQILKSIQSMPLLGDVESSWLYDMISYWCLFPAYDSKGRQISVDQFDKSDFDAMKFVVNGIHPKSLFITNFDCFMIIVHFICISLVPFVIGFYELLNYEVLNLFDIGITVFYTLESLITIITPQSKMRSTIYSIREYESMRPFLSAWITSWLKSHLIFDLISTIPFAAIFPTSLTGSYRFLTLLRLVRIFRLPTTIKRCAYYTLIRIKTEKLIGIGYSKIVPIGIAIFIYIHYNACMLYYCGLVNGFPGWTSLWGSIDTASLGERYTWAFLLGVGNMFPLSFKPQSLGEQILSILFIFVGAALYATFVGYISSAAITIDNSGRLYNQKMEELVDYIKWRKLSDETKLKLVSYYETKYRGKYFEEDTLLSEMNEALRTEIKLHNTRDLIVKVPFLRREMGDNRDEIFYSRIASVLHVRYFIPGDNITKQGESGADMFFILSGKVDVFVDGKYKVSLYDGSYFGEVALITKVLR
ncbi:hypothetical protein BCR33DRAFT_766667, partial [Rhizoclosmatium globosum]